ncbi:hypothetical protein Cgig2_029453 [Carnegiea gigantea]|uniref:Protein kinase domain-containing protein n=1 Tax=Carnegiea gigantea TaxID=171969 RepID=A0A9Q1QKM8_9CARY|nr:hypothetical protein Cgig2_029453 [Carnegiea gigantea]
MRYLCNVESAVATCDSYNFDKPNLNLSLRSKNKKKTNHHHSTKIRRFTFAELESATNGFSPRTFLGKGSQASVFLATLDGGALTAAVKRTAVSVTATAENEIEVLSKIWSRRIVNLIGYAVDSLGGDRKRLLLVVEYMPNGSLYDLIHKNPKPPGWSKRVRFALQIAKAVQALHGSNPPVIHRDIKSSNVLIDERGNARLSDFGLALRGHVEDVRVMSTPPAGTLGYLDPCYLAPADVSPKSDVFSFGILLLEMVSGRRAIDVNYSPPSILEWALPLVKSGNYQGICDRRIRGPTDPTVSRELALLAVRCVRSKAERRPAMAEVVECLKTVYKRVRVAPLWNNLRRRVGDVERSPPLGGGGFDGSDGEEKSVRTSRHGSRRTLSGRSRKVSSVPSPDQCMLTIEEVATRGRQRVGRSKSVGSFRDIKVRPEVEEVKINPEIKEVNVLP